MAELKKYVTVESTGSIPELGGISGPILNPCYLPLTVVMRLITARKKVYEVNPNNTAEKVLLTTSNVRKTHFEPKKPVVKPAVGPTLPKKEEKVVNETKSEKKVKEAKKAAEKKVEADTKADAGDFAIQE